MKAVVTVERRDTVGIIRLVNVERRNPLTNQMRDELSRGYRDLADDPDVRAIVLTGKGAAFCGGGDLAMMRDESDPWSTHQRMRRTSAWLTDLMRSPKPVVVGVNGVAVGGGIGLALVGDLVIAAESAKFMAGFLRIGLIPDIGVMYTLPRLVGLARARQFIFGDQAWTAPQAEAVGLISMTVPDDELEEQCVAAAVRLARAPIEAVGLTKWLMNRSFEASLDEMMTYENLGQSLAYSTAAMREGLAALTEGRAPDFAAASEQETATKLMRQRRQSN